MDSNFNISDMPKRDSLNSANPVSTAETRKIGHIKFGVMSAEEIVSSLSSYSNACQRSKFTIPRYIRVMALPLLAASMT